MSKRKREVRKEEECTSPLIEDVARAVFSCVERDDLDMLILATQLNTTSYQFIQSQLVSLAEEVMTRVEKLYLPVIKLSFSESESEPTLVERLVDDMFLSGMTLFTTKDQFQHLLKLDQTKLGRTLLKYLKLTQLKQKHLDENETHRGQDNCSPYRMLMDGPQPTTNLWNVFTLCDGRRYRRLFECLNIAVCDDMSRIEIYRDQSVHSLHQR